jgi:hypothetical protein
MITPPEPSHDIRSYILRIWVEEEDGRCMWRASLTAIPGGERLGFASLQMAFKFLEEQTRRDQTPKGSQENQD